MSKIYVGDIGTEFIIDTGSDLSTATITNILVEKPDKTITTWSGVVDGLTSIKYLTVDGDMDQAGKYKCQVIVSLPGWSGSGETFTFQAYKQFK